MAELSAELRRKHTNWALGQKGPPWLLKAADEIDRLSTITDEMVERGKRALHEVSTYRGYNEETLAMEYLRMERIYEAHVRAVLTAALSR